MAQYVGSRDQKVKEANRDSERLKWMAQEFIRPRHNRTIQLIKHVKANIPGLDEVNPVMLLYMITAISQVPYLLTAEMKYVHGINAMQAKAIEAHCDAVVAFLFR